VARPPLIARGRGSRVRAQLRRLAGATAYACDCVLCMDGCGPAVAGRLCAACAKGRDNGTGCHLTAMEVLARRAAPDPA
jgi:hypothetical protein